VKKLFLGLIATVMFCFVGNAQNASYCKSAMTVVVASAKDTYVKGMTYKEWLAAQVRSVTPSKEEDKFLSDVFSYICTSSNSENVLKTYDGKSLLDLAFLNSKNGLKALKEGTFSSQNRWCIWCIIKIAIDIICQIVNCQASPNLPPPLFP
jgi:hypothetical protein